VPGRRGYIALSYDWPRGIPHKESSIYPITCRRSSKVDQADHPKVAEARKILPGRLLRAYFSDVWSDPTVRERLSWYYQVLRDLKPAKFLVCKQVSCSQDPRLMTEDELWKEHGRLRQQFGNELKAVREGRDLPRKVERPNFSFLDLKAELLKRILRRCIFCEWRCKVDRVDGRRKGACHLDSAARVATFFLHRGEEPPLVDRFGSGTIFFTSCTFRCAFCQNWDISQCPDAGAPVTPGNLSLIIKSLRRDGAANINFVGGEPTPNLHVIMEALNFTSVNVPILWNSNMYLTPEAIQILADVVDIWLPDFKWGNDRCAVKYSRIIRYLEVVSRNHAVAHEKGDMIVRHLVMPGHLECCTKPVLNWIAENCPRALVNVMNQYRPDHLVLREPEKYHEIARRPSTDEIREARGYAEGLGLAWKPVS
jgi:putative pyruvate formate lyase activating enzyme